MKWQLKYQTTLFQRQPYHQPYFREYNSFCTLILCYLTHITHNRLLSINSATHSWYSYGFSYFHTD